LSRGFIDFAGRIAEVVDANTGELIPVQIFVAVRQSLGRHLVPPFDKEDEATFG
jgi:hypothetical protein